MPPRVDDRSRPDRAYETFRGALARDEFPREYDCLDDRLKETLGVPNRPLWSEMRTLVLKRSHIVVRGIKRSKVRNVELLAPDRARVDLSFPFGIKGWVLMRRHTVLRIYVEGSDHPPIDWIVARGDPRLDPIDGIVSFEYPPADVRLWANELQEEGKAVRKFEVVDEWFLEDYEIGGRTPQAAKKKKEEAES